MPALASLAAFAQAVAEFPASDPGLVLEPAAQAAAERSVRESWVSRRAPCWRPGVREIRIDYRGGRFYNLGPRRFAPRAGSGRLPPRLVLRNENLTLVLPAATEAVVPQRPSG